MIDPNHWQITTTFGVGSPHGPAQQRACIDWSDLQGSSSVTMSPLGLYVASICSSALPSGAAATASRYSTTLKD